MRKIYALLFTVVLFVSAGVKAQVSTTVTMSATPIAGSPFSSLSAAITAVNGLTITGPVVVTAAAGTETAPNGTGYYITATGTVSNTIVITGTSTTTITAGFNTAAGVFDAIFKIVGGDYITIQNFTMQENSGNTVTTTGATNTMTEAAVLLIHASATDGAQNNTIQNNIITLNNTYTNSVGILSTSSSTTSNASPGASITADATSTAGTNSNNKVYGNTISNVAYGIYFICPPLTATVFETGNDIGGSSAPTGNTITFGNATAGSGPWNRSTSTNQTGIGFRNGGHGNNVRYNSVTSNSAAYVGSAGLNGIQISSGTAPVGVTYSTTISNNTVILTTTGVALITGIDFGAGLSTGTIASSNNSITINQNSITTVSAAIIGLKSNYACAGGTLNTNTIVINQAFTATATVTNSSPLTGITVPSGTTGTPTVNVLGNTITFNRSTTVSATFTATMSGALIGIQATTATTTMNIGAAGGGNNNTITFKEAAGGGAGTTTYSSAVTYIDASATHATVNVVNNTLNTSGSTIRSTGSLTGVNQNSTVTVLVNIKSNTMNVDRVAATGTLVSFTTTTGTPSEVADTVSNNNITFTSIAGTTAVTAISSLGGPSSPAVNNKSISNNTISISGTHTGTSIGITCSFTNTGFITGNSITITSASPTVTGITTTGTVMTIRENTLSLTSSTISPTAMTGINESGTGAHSITNNTFSAMNFTGIITGSPTISGIAVSSNSGANLFNNIITNISVGAATSTATPTIGGIVISGGTSINVYKNKIHGITTAVTGATGFLDGIRISGGTTVNVYNNLIGNLTASASTNPDAIRGINITSTTASSTLNIYYNTVYLSGAGSTNFGSTGLFHAASATATTVALNLRNNIIYNGCTPNGTGLVVAFRRSSGITSTLANYASTSNNNLFYAGTPGVSNLIYSDGTSSAQTMSAYKNGVFTAGTITPRDAQSFSEDPEFQSTTGSSADFLKYKVSSAKQVESGAVGIGSAPYPAPYNDDYSGTVRHGSTGYAGTGSAPDVGAWELEGIAADLTAPSITYTALSSTACTSARTLSATITDASTVNTTTYQPRLYYKKSTTANTFAGNASGDDGWKYVVSTTGSSPFSFTFDHSLFGVAPTAGDIIEYFVVAQDQASTPNVGVSTSLTFAGNSTPANIDLEVSGVTSITGTPTSYTLTAAGLSGIVNVGVSETYTSLTETGATGLFNIINTNGIDANLTINLMDASITETGAVALNAVTYTACSGGPFTITIKPNTTTTLTGTVNTGAIIKLNGADYVVIDGSNNGSSSRDLTIENLTTTTSGNAVVWLASPASGNGSTNNTIKNCIIQGNSATTSYLGMFVGGNTTISITTAGAEKNSNNTISNNLFRKSQYGLALYGYSTTLPDENNVISNNNFGTATVGEGFSLIALNVNRQDNMTISGNEIQNVSIGGTATSSQFGIRLIDFKNSLCYKNKIHSISYTGTSFAKTYGIGMTNSSYITVGNPSNSTIHNNWVYNLTSSGNSGTWGMTGILASAGYGDKIYFNSVHLTGQLANATGGFVAAFANGDGTITTVGTNIDVRNNIFSVTGSNAGSSGNFWAFYTKATTLTGSTINYNNLYCNGTGTSLTNNVGYFNSISYPTLTGWRTATGQSANDLAVDPQFTSTTDLHINSGLSQTQLESGGVAISGITTDIDGDTRPGPVGSVNGGGTAPDIGADEFDGVPIPACSTPTNQPTSLILNATGQTSVSGSYTAASPAPTNYLVVRTTASSLAANPLDATTYTVGTNTYFGTGGYVESVGSGLTISSTGLTAETTYYYWIFSFNNENCSGGPLYQTTTPLSGNITTGSSITSFQTGAWENTSTWVGGVVPTSSSDVTIAATHVVTISSTAATAASLAVNATGQLDITGSTLAVGTTITNSGTININGGTTTVTGASTTGVSNTGTFNISSGTFNVSSDGANNRRFTSATGALNVTGGTLNVFGNFAVNSGNFTQSAGLISINGNNGIVAVAGGTHLCVINTAGTINASGGTIRVVNPSVATSTRSVYVDGQSNATSFTGTHTFEFGDGTNNVAGTTEGFVIENYSSSRLPIQNVIVNSANGGTNRFVRNTLATGNGTYIKGNLTINSGGEFRWVTAATGDNTVGGNVINNGTLTSLTEFGLGAPGDASALYVPSAAQTISGSGVFQNATSSSTAQFSNIRVVNSGGTVTFNSGILPSTSGNLTITDGTVIADAFSFNGTTAQSCVLTAATSLLNVGNLTNNNTGGTVTFSGSGFCNITETLAFGNVNSRTLAAAGRIVLKSTSINNTARVADLTNAGLNSGNTISGNVTTERFLPLGKKAYRQLASGVTTTNFISNNWQQGIYITGSTSGANGFDATQTGQPNMFTYTPGAANFTAIPNTNATNLNAKTGYRVFVMGNRTASNLTVNPGPGIGQPNDNMNAATTISATGTILTGAQTYTGAELASNVSDYALIANPYWSPVDWDAVTKNNVANTYWIWDPSIGNRGAYTSWTTGSGASGGGSINQHIQPGQAIFVQTSGASPSITFNEANKTSTFSNTFRPSGLSPSKLILSLIGAYGSNPVIVKDASTIAFRDDFYTAIGAEDATKLTNTDENIALINNNTALGLEARPTVANSDIIPVRLWKLFSNNTYSLKLNAQDFDAGIQAYLRDKKL
ncbi:MAG: hypothetical protein KGZ59_01050, partial [Chitinophagaceae bacterium]|nr:hypothetical protein [Chitinophagaceae bacterium]